MTHLIDWFRATKQTAEQIGNVTRLRKLLDLKEAELELAQAQADDMRRQRDALARSVALHLGKRMSPGKHVLMLPRLNHEFDETENVQFLEIAGYTQVMYSRHPRNWSLSPAS